MSEIRAALERRISIKDNTVTRNFREDEFSICKECREYTDQPYCPHCNLERDLFIDECCLSWELVVAGHTKQTDWLGKSKDFLTACVKEWDGSK